MTRAIYQAAWDELLVPPTTAERYDNARRLWSLHGVAVLEAVNNLAGFLVNQAVSGRPTTGSIQPRPPNDEMLDALGDRERHLELARNSWNHLTGRLLEGRMGVADPKLAEEAGAFVLYGHDAVYWFAYWAISAMDDMERRLSEDEYVRRVNSVAEEFGVE